MISTNDLGLNAGDKRHSNSPIWVTVTEAIRLSGIRRTRLYECLNDGTLRSIKVGRKRLISYASIEGLGQ
jgi:excisionase family DNA binding protein